MTTTSDTVDYVRRARRLRHIYRHRPDRLHRSLREIEPPHDDQLRHVARLSITPLPTTAPHRAQAFADHVATHLEGSILRYSVRLALLREAQRRGIERFEANLIIAAVQHKADRKFVEDVSRSHERRRRLPLRVLTVVVIQTMILAAGYAIFA